MVLQNLLNERDEFIIYEDADQGGHVKTLNDPPDRIQRKEITSRGPESKMRVKVSLFTCVHGYLDKDHNVPASLIILDAQFRVIGTAKARFRYAEIRMQFRNASLASTPPPDVIGYAPFRTEEKFNVTTEERRKKLALGVTIGTTVPATFQINPAWEYESSFKRRYFDRGSAGTGYNAEYDCEDSVWWALQESKNPHQKDGIRPDCRFAVLIKRQDNQGFLGDFRVTVDGGTFYNVSEEWKFKRGRTVPDDPINFHPDQKPQGQHEGIDPSNLGIWVKDSKLIALTTLPGLEPLESSSSQKE